MKDDHDHDHDQAAAALPSASASAALLELSPYAHVSLWLLVGYGVMIWLVPFGLSLFLVGPRRTYYIPQPLFKIIMVLTAVATTLCAQHALFVFTVRAAHKAVQAAESSSPTQAAAESSAQVDLPAHLARVVHAVITPMFGAFVGTVWTAINLALDVLILVPLAKFTAHEYITEIGLYYMLFLMLPWATAHLIWFLTSTGALGKIASAAASAAASVAGAGTAAAARGGVVL